MAPSSRLFDITVIGAGSGGLAAALTGAALGLRVALVERERLGGECLWTGCVPSKALLHAASLAQAAREVARWNDNDASAPPLDFKAVIQHVHAARTTIEASENQEALEQQGITVVHGVARIVAPGIVAVGDRQLQSRHIVIATGSRPAVPSLPGLEEAGYFTNETVFDQLEELPARLAIIGGGPVGIEFAQAFGRLGSHVTVLCPHPLLMPREEQVVSQAAHTFLEREGVVPCKGVTVQEVVPGAAHGAHRVIYRTADGERSEIVADRIIVAIGRCPNVEGFGLTEIGIQVEESGVRVDSYLRTTVPGIWACGDAVGGYLFTHVAEAEARLIVRNIMFPWVMERMDYSVVPWTTFTEPEIGRVGLTEQEARERYGSKVMVERFPLSRTDRAVTDGATDGFIKLVMRGKRILGAYIIGPRAGELIQQVALMMRHKLPVSALAMIHTYPTYSYALHQANDARMISGLARSRPRRWFHSALRLLSRR
ncbi:MAG: pyridine nucleotide-disulfide oxidoreductase [Dehalococcoidia bacterium]|nr:pyridine nucleotide-disulfide oxidoreductase [Dehalococcoidia bacterium]